MNPYQGFLYSENYTSTEFITTPTNLIHSSSQVLTLVGVSLIDYIKLEFM